MKTPRHETDEFRKAGERIRKQRSLYKGARPAALAWVVEFAQREIDTYSLGELSDRWEEVKRFSLDAGVGQDDPQSIRATRVRNTLPGRLANPFTEIRQSPGSAERAFLQMLQQELNAYLGLYVSQGEVRTNGVVLDLVVRKGSSMMAISADLHPSFLYQFFNLLADFGANIKTCRRCPRLFLAKRSDRQWCSGTCQVTQWKIDHPESKAAKQTSPKGDKHGKKR
jgi:ribosomal protein S27AE